MSSRDDRPDDRRDEDLEARLDELEAVLTELRRDLRETERDRRAPLQPPRPPRLSELVRFTEQYTIPTIIALLETTIKSLELLQGTLRLVDPSRSVAGDASATADRLADVRDGASAGLARSLSELRTALSEADLPEEAASRSIIADARDLTAEIEDRIEEGRREADAARRSDRGDRRDRHDRSDRHGRRDDEPKSGRSTGAAGDESRGIRIDVTDPDAEPEEDAVGAGDADAVGDVPEDGPAPEVDVESELESIKRQMDDSEADTADEDAADDEAGDNDADRGETDDGDADRDEADDSDQAGDSDADRDGT